MRCVLTALPFAFLLLSGPSWPADQEGEMLKERARDILARPSYQKELVKPDSDWYRIQPSQPLDSPRGMGLFGQMLLYIGLGLMAGFILIWLIAYGRGRSKEAKNASSPTTLADENSIIQNSLSEVDEMAKNGRYGEAVHLLLLLAVKHLSAKRKGFIPWDLTSRELLKALPGNPEERNRFRSLVATVELFLFGGRSVSESSYRTCLETYKGLLQ